MSWNQYNYYKKYSTLSAADSNKYYKLQDKNNGPLYIIVSIPLK